MRNVSPKSALEIGTSSGRGTALMATNSPDSIIYTVNIKEEDITRGKGGKNITHSLSKDEIGIEYRKLGLQNIRQIYADTMTWDFDIAPIDVATSIGAISKSHVIVSA